MSTKAEVSKNLLQERLAVLKKFHWLNFSFISSSLNLNLHRFRIDFYMDLHRFSMDLIDNIPIDPVGMKVSLVLGHLPALGRVSNSIC